MRWQPQARDRANVYYTTRMEQLREINSRPSDDLVMDPNPYRCATLASQAQEQLPPLPALRQQWAAMQRRIRMLTTLRPASERCLAVRASHGGAR